MKCEIHIDCSDGLTFKRPSLVKVQFADECDLSKIISKFMRTGELPNLSVKKPLNIDATNLSEDFQAFQEWKVNLSNAFEAEPLEVREAFQHDVERWAEFKALPEEQQEAFWKQLKQPAEPIPSNQEPTNEPPATPVA